MISEEFTGSSTRIQIRSIPFEMFEGFTEVCRNFGVKADVRHLLLAQKALERDLIATLGDLFLFFKATIVKDPQHIGPFSQAFYHYFINIDILPNERLSDAIARSDSFRDWLDDILQTGDEVLDLDMNALIDQFLDEIHLTSYDIQKVLDGEDILNNDNPNQADRSAVPRDESHAEMLLEKAADYRLVDLEELKRRMEKVMKQQKTFHRGGSHWIGSSGISPYGHGGAAMGGIRINGSGGGKMARAVVDDPKYYPVDVNSRIGDNNMDAALAGLKGILEESHIRYLDIPDTIKNGLKQGGIFLPVESEKKEDKIQVMLFIDNGGYSMDYYIRSVQQVFRKMKTRFQHDLEIYYFHNTIYKYLYEDERRTRAIPIERLLSKDPNYKLFVIGDAAMAPYELHQESVISWGRFKEKYKKMAWLNPVDESHWPISWTTSILGKIVPMYPMTPKGLENAIQEMNRTGRLTNDA